ncbi:MAG: MraY family glycosyltransferase, partial [Rikenellaceae bacterium]
QVIAAIFITYSGTYFTTLNGIFGVYDIPLFIGLPLTIFFLVFVTNAINLIDGLDGLSSSLSIMALVTYGVIFYINGELTDAIVVCAMLGALMPFCYNNIYGVRRRGRCKIFMGDTGALVVGAVLGFLAIKLWEMGARGGFDERHHITAVLAYSVLIIPCFDVVRIVIHRFRDHKPLFLPDKNHIHHKFLALGFTPRQSLKNILAMNTLFIIGNLSLVSYLNFSTIIVIDIVVWSTIHIVITKKIALRHKQIDNIM